MALTIKTGDKKRQIMGHDKHDRTTFIEWAKDGEPWTWRVGSWYCIDEQDDEHVVIWQYKGRAADEHKALDMAKTHAIVDPLNYIELQ